VGVAHEQNMKKPAYLVVHKLKSRRPLLNGDLDKHCGLLNDYI